MIRADVEGLDEFLEDVKAEDTTAFLSKVEDLQLKVSYFVDATENKVNEALDLLEGITCIADLGKVEECRDVLKGLATDLY